MELRNQLLDKIVAKYGSHKDYSEENGFIIFNRDNSIEAKFPGTNETLHSPESVAYLKTKTFLYYDGDFFTFFRPEDNHAATYVAPVPHLDRVRTTMALRGEE